MRSLLDECIGPLSPGSRFAVGRADALAASWLRKTRTPYMRELDAIASLIAKPGVFMLNSSYEWGCTAMAAPTPAKDSAFLIRTLDWPLNGLGRNIELVRQKGPAGEFLNVTWPGAVGVLTAMAPGRFAASINQAPIKRRFSSDLMLGVDGALNTFDTWWNITDQPSMHVLRHVFEQARTFAEARSLLETTPIAAATIFTLAGIEPSETCVIERDRNGYKTHKGIASAANDWRYGSFPGQWQALGGDAEDKRGDSKECSDFLETFATRQFGNFDWVKAPVLNGYTRIAVEANARQGSIRVRGYEATGDGNSAEPATQVLDYRA